MSLLDIKLYGDPVLRRETLPVSDFGEELTKLVEDMLETMYINGGIGLAAPQVDVTKSVIVLDVTYAEEDGEQIPIVMINPDIHELSGSTVMEEGCLSIPDVRVEVERPEKIRVKYQDLKGKKHDLPADDLLARVILHEVDHLKGRLMIDYLSPVKRNLLKNKNRHGWGLRRN